MKNKSKRSSGLLGKAGSAPVPQKLLFSFKDFDNTQGQTFSQWERESLLGLMLDKLSEYSKMTRPEAEKAKFRVYGSFPPRSTFRHPKYIAEDAEWASMHIQGKECIAGHVIGNVFYIVFLDKDHKFWITEKKHT